MILDLTAATDRIEHLLAMWSSQKWSLDAYIEVPDVHQDMENYPVTQSYKRMLIGIGKGIAYCSEDGMEESVTAFP